MVYLGEGREELKYARGMGGEEPRVCKALSFPGLSFPTNAQRVALVV